MPYKSSLLGFAFALIPAFISAPLRASGLESGVFSPPLDNSIEKTFESYFDSSDPKACQAAAYTLQERYSLLTKASIDSYSGQIEDGACHLKIGYFPSSHDSRFLKEVPFYYRASRNGPGGNIGGGYLTAAACQKDLAHQVALAESALRQTVLFSDCLTIHDPPGSPGVPQASVPVIILPSFVDGTIGTRELYVKYISLHSPELTDFARWLVDETRRNMLAEGALIAFESHEFYPNQHAIFYYYRSHTPIPGNDADMDANVDVVGGQPHNYYAFGEGGFLDGDGAPFLYSQEKDPCVQQLPSVLAILSNYGVTPEFNTPMCTRYASEYRVQAIWRGKRIEFKYQDDAAYPDYTACEAKIPDTIILYRKLGYDVKGALCSQRVDQLPYFITRVFGNF